MCRYLAVVLVAAGCVGEIGGAAPLVEDPGAPDAGSVVTPPQPDAAVTPTHTGDAAPPAVTGIAPAGAVPGERAAADGANPFTIGLVPTVFRVDAEPRQHVAFVLSFAGGSGVVMAADRWDDAEAVELGYTNGGAGQRFLAVLDPAGRRTYWVRVHAESPLAATLTVTRTAFADGARCTSDCARLLQMPLPNDPVVDGYDTDSGTYFRYWFGRRDLVMMVRRAARARADAGQAPIFPYDFSQWNGETPGVDVGAPRHVSHQRGKDVDISLYGMDGAAVWRSYCTTHVTSDGRECIAGTRQNFDGVENALQFASHLESGRVTMSFLDRELIPAVRSGASAAVQSGALDPSLLPLYSDGQHIQHWPNHDNHIHVRVSETDYNAKIAWPEPFEAP